MRSGAALEHENVIVGCEIDTGDIERPRSADPGINLPLTVADPIAVAEEAGRIDVGKAGNSALRGRVIVLASCRGTVAAIEQLGGAVRNEAGRTRDERRLSRRAERRHGAERDNSR